MAAISAECEELAEVQVTGHGVRADLRKGKFVAAEASGLAFFIFGGGALLISNFLIGQI